MIQTKSKSIETIYSSKILLMGPLVRVNTLSRYVIGGDPKEWISDVYVPGKIV